MSYDTLQAKGAKYMSHANKPHRWAQALWEWEKDYGSIQPDWHTFALATVTEWVRQLADDAGLIWVDADTTRKIAQLVDEVPEPMDIMSLRLPGNHGLVVLAEPIYLWKQEVVEVAVAALGWSILRTREGNYMLSVEPWFENHSEDFKQFHGLVAPGPGGWIEGLGPRIIDGVGWDEDPEMLAPVKWLVALAAYCAGNVVVTDEHAPDRPTRKSLKRVGMTDAKVSVVKMRRPEPIESERSEPTGKKIGEGKRWVVRGHWRQQPCGPGRSMRRDTYITDYVKGDPDAPLVQGVQKLWKVDR